jgi:hypothetical protein
MADNLDAPVWRKISISLEILGNISYVLRHLDKNVAGREHLHELMSDEIGKLILICKDSFGEHQEN